MDKLSPGLVKFFRRGSLLFPTTGVLAVMRVYAALRGQGGGWFADTPPPSSLEGTVPLVNINTDQVGVANIDPSGWDSSETRVYTEKILTGYRPSVFQSR